MSGHEDDDILCTRAQNGCEEAFKLLFDRYYPLIHSFVYRLCWDASRAEDIAQETFIKVARALPTFRRQSSFKSWLYQIAMNASRDWQRRDGRERQVFADFAAEEGRDSSRPPDFEPVQAALSSLAVDQRQAIVLTFYEGLNHAEAARVLGCAETTVSWRVFRAKRTLKRLLNQNQEARVV